MDQPLQNRREITTGAVVAPPPAWVDLAPYAIPETPNPHFIANGVCALLDDSQIDLCGPERAWFYRRADMVTASAGAEHVAQFSVSFDPAFERVEVHAITVIRGGERIDHAGTAFFEVLRRERNLERLQFDGRLTAHVTIPDVRQGDVVETAYTLYGMRKSLNGRHSAFIALEWPVGIVEVRLRQRAPRDKKIAERGYNRTWPATETEAEGVSDRRWRIVEQRGARYEQLTPPWTLQGAALQFSEWGSWGEVADAFRPLYEGDDVLPADAEAEIARIAAAEATPAGRTAAALRYTQSALRYLAISIGEGGYTPRALSDIGATRYGDCKDKSKLFVAMARRLGVDACAALVNTRDGYSLPDYLPSAQLFDHCIVRVAIDKNVYWLDPTRQLQPSPLDNISQCYFGWALPLHAGVAALERMGEPPMAHLTETKEQITLGDRPEAPVRYEWENIFRGVRAEGVREQFARDGSVSVFKAYADDIQRVWPKARVVSQDLVSDDVANNVVTVREVYELDDAWEKLDDSNYQFHTRDLTLRGSLAPLDPGERKHPIFLGQPGRRTRHVDVRTAMKHSGGWSRRAGSGGISFNDELRTINSNWLVLEQTLVIGGLTLPANEVETYRQVHQGLNQNELVITEVLRGKKFTNRNQSGGGEPQFSLRWLLFFLVVISVIARCAANQ